MQQLDIIVGVSYFTGGPVVGIALKGEKSASGATKWAETFKHGRPASVEPRNGRDTTEEAEITYLANKWQEWADLNNIQVKINRKPRRVKAPF